MTRPEVPAHLFALLMGATRAWPRLLVTGNTLHHADGSYDRLILDPPGDWPEAVDAQPGDLVLIPSYGKWNVAAVLAPDEDLASHMWVATVHEVDMQAALAGTGTYPPPVSVFPVQRNNCYRPPAAERRAVRGAADGQ